MVVQAINSLRFVPAGAAHPSSRPRPRLTRQRDHHRLRAAEPAFDPANPCGIKVKIDPVGMALIKKGPEHFSQFCFACHGPDGKGVVTSDGMHLAPPLAGSPRVLGSPEALVRIVLHGLTGDVDGKAYPGLMVPKKANDDHWIAEVLTYVRNSFGNSAPTITPPRCRHPPAASGEHQPYTLADSRRTSVPRDVMTNGSSAPPTMEGHQARARRRPKSRWSTGKPQQEGNGSSSTWASRSSSPAWPSMRRVQERLPAQI